ncbi:MAG: hypothetical protein OXR66_08935 [Candidatus Woesearchaeota archaeon]|nr:hypothetical protein [Candidatus Woesearchaeota archaeon]
MNPQRIVLPLGVLLILRGLSGFVYDGLLLGVLRTTIDHNLLHTFAGLGFLAASVWGNNERVRAVLKYFGGVYLCFAIAGMLFVNVTFFTDAFGANTLWDNLSHVVVAGVCLYVGYKHD